MYPYLFPESVHLSSYGVFFVLSVLVTVYGSRYMIKNRTPYSKNKIALLVVLCLVAGIIGARLLHVVTHRSSYMAQPDLIFSLSVHWFSWYGAIILMLVVWGGLCLWWKYNPCLVADLAAPSLGVGIAVMRLWCFLHGCCFWKETHLPRWIMPSAWSEAAKYQLYEQIGTGNFLWNHELHTIHPTQLYDWLLALSWAWLSYYLWKKWLPTWVSSLFFLVWYTVWRYFLAPFRAPSLTYDAFPMFFPMLYSVILVLAVLIVMFCNRK